MLNLKARHIYKGIWSEANAQYSFRFHTLPWIFPKLLDTFGSHQKAFVPRWNLLVFIWVPFHSVASSSSQTVTWISDRSSLFSTINFLNYSYDTIVRCFWCLCRTFQGLQIRSCLIICIVHCQHIRFPELHHNLCLGIFRSRSHSGTLHIWSWFFSPDHFASLVSWNKRVGSFDSEPKFQI